MLKKLFNKIKRAPKKPAEKHAVQTHAEPHIVPRDQHCISRRDISPSAVKVMYRLNEAGHEAYLVGGSVRDILLGDHPKDFDIATDATPEQVKALFRNSRIIGRRFRIVHVTYGREIIEVTTFRAHHESATHAHTAKQNTAGMLTRDNVFGSVEEDAARRDFTVNALYYTVKDFSIVDFVGGLQDLDNHIIRMIGDPEVRYREDPVRLLRAMRAAAKTGFTIEPATAKPIRPLSHLLLQVSPARLFDEMIKLLMTGSGEATWAQMADYGLDAMLLPGSAPLLSTNPFYASLVQHALISTDQRIAADKGVTPAFLFAALLWPACDHYMQRLVQKGTPVMLALQQAANHVLAEQCRITTIPRRFSSVVVEIWQLQQRLPRRNGTRAMQLLTHPRFRAAYDFLLLREAAGEDTGGLGAWWTDFQNTDEAQRERMAAQVILSAEAHAPRKKRRRRRRPNAAPHANPE